MSQQPQQQQATDGAAWRATLERQAVWQALEQQLGQVEQARAAYAQQAGAAFDVAYAEFAFQLSRIA